MEYINIIVLVIVLIPTISIFFKAYRRPTSKNSSVLLSYYSEFGYLHKGSENLLPDGSGHINLLLVSKPKTPIKQSLVIDLVYLPFTTNIRLLAIPKNSKNRINPSFGNSLMEPVSLEGDFPNFFSLYSNKNQGTEARYVLDPAAMAFVVDVCKKYSWEIVNNELIFVSDNGLDPETLQKFISEIRPSIEVPAETLHMDTRKEYIPSFLRQLKCPICQSKTKYISGSTYKCPNGHGRLVTGKELNQLSKQNPTKIKLISDNSDRDIKCPNCSQLMTKLYYRGATIDSCINCPFRWLDNGEFN